MKQNKYSNSGPPEKSLNFSQMPKQTPKQQKEQELKKQLDEYNKKKLQQGRQDWQEVNDVNTLDQRNILQGMWNIAQFVDPGISTNIVNIGINKLRGTPQEGGDYAGILASLIPYTKYGMKGEKLAKPWIKKLLEYTDKGEDAYSIVAQQYGGEANWLDNYDEELKYGGMKKLPGSKKFTSKNIQSSINTLFSRNHDLFGPSGKKYYSPLSKYAPGGEPDVPVIPDPEMVGYVLPEVTVTADAPDYAPAVKNFMETQGTEQGYVDALKRDYITQQSWMSWLGREDLILMIELPTSIN